MNSFTKKIKPLFLILALVLLASACGKATELVQEQQEQEVQQEQDIANEVAPIAPPTTDNCVPLTCESQGKNCGEISDGCGGTVICGECQGDFSCGGSGTPNVCGSTQTCYRYAYISDRDFSADNLLLADTCDQHQPRNMSGNDVRQFSVDHPAFKPDGSRLSYEKKSFGTDDFATTFLVSIPANPNSLFSREEIGSGDLGAFDDGAFFAGLVTFEPSGNRIAFVQKTEELDGLGPNANVVQLHDLMLFDPATGSPAQQIIPFNLEARFNSIAWHPDRNRLFFSRRIGNDPALIHVHFIDTQRSIPVSQEPEGNTFAIPLEGSQVAMSLDGRSLAFVRRISNNNHIFTCKLREPQGTTLQRQLCGELRQLTFEGQNSHPSWTPDGRFLLFSKRIGDRQDIYQMQANGRNAHPLTQGIGLRNSQPVVHPVSFTLTQEQ